MKYKKDNSYNYRQETSSYKINYITVIADNAMSIAALQCDY